MISEPRVDLDVEAAFEWYEKEQPGLGLEFLADHFLAALQHVFDRLITFPAFGQPYPTPNHSDLRRVVLPKLPLSVFYRTIKTTRRCWTTTSRRCAKQQQAPHGETTPVKFHFAEPASATED